MYDLAIIGSGWAGFNAAIEAKKIGKSVCLIEKDQLGGTCLNYGCIPTKVLTHFAKENQRPLTKYLSILRKEQQDIITKLKQGIEFVLKSQHIDLIKGTAKVISKNKILINEENSGIEADFILFSVGTKPKDLPFFKEVKII